jgi:hypothetical protein
LSATQQPSNPVLITIDSLLRLADFEQGERLAAHRVGKQRAGRCDGQTISVA